MSVDSKDLIVVGGIGIAALMLLSRKRDEPFSMGDVLGGGGSRETVTTIEEIPTEQPMPTITLPSIEPYPVNTSIPDWLFSTPAPVIDGGGNDSVDVIPMTKKETVPPSITSSTYTTGDPIHPSVGPAGGFGGGGVGGRGGGENNIIEDVLKRLFSPLALLASATPFGIVAAAPQAGLALATAITKKDEKVAEKSAFESATNSAASVGSTSGGGITTPVYVNISNISGSSGYGGGGSGGSSASGTGSSKKTVSTPSASIGNFFSAGQNYGSATVVGQSSAGTVYQHSGGARSVVSGGQIVAGSSRALDAADIARLPKKMREALGY